MTEPESGSIEPGATDAPSFQEYPAFDAPPPASAAAPVYGASYAPQAPQPQMPYGTPYGTPYGQPPQPPKKSRTGLIIGIVIGAVVLFLAVIVIVPMIFFGKVFSDLDSTLGDYNMNTEQILAEQLEVTFGTFATTHEKYHDETKLPVTFKNKGSETKTFHVQVEAVDAAGDRIAEDSSVVENLAPGQSATDDMFTYVNNSEAAKLPDATFKVFKVTSRSD